MPQALLYDSHCHTPLCRHAVGEPEEYAAIAMQRGLAGLTITCHGPTSREWDYCMRSEQWPEYLRLCGRARAAFAGQIDVRTGVECDFMPGMESYWSDFLDRYDLSHVLGSVHPHVGDYRKAFATGDALAYQETYFDHLALAAETRLFDTLSHPDIVKNIDPQQWQLDRILPAIQKSLDRIALTGVAMELNTSGLGKDIAEMNPAPAILREMARRGIPVVLGSDAHSPQRVASHFEDALYLLQQCGFHNVSFFVDRRRRDVNLHAAQASLISAAACSQ